MPKPKFKAVVLSFINAISKRNKAKIKKILRQDYTWPWGNRGNDS